MGESLILMNRFSYRNAVSWPVKLLSTLNSQPFPVASHVAELLAAIVDSSDDAIVSKSLDGIITSWNRSAERIFGYTAAEAIGRPITMIVPSDRQDEEPKILARLRVGDRVDHFETVRVRKDGTLIDISLTISPIRDSQGRVVGASKVARDISDRKHAEALAARAKRELQLANDRLKEVDRLKSEFLASMSHELRTPLNSIIGFTGLLEQQIPGPLNEEQLKQLGMVSNSARHLLHLINEILDLSRIEAGRVEVNLHPTNLLAVVKQAVESQRPLAERKKLRLRSEIPPDLTLVTDPKLLTQVLLNLVSNAVKFTESGTVEVQAETSAAHVRVTIADTGIGIKQEQLTLLFQPFRQLEGSTRRQHEGTGLGLHISKRILELLGGDIHVDSEFGKGTRLIFTLPYHGNQPQAQDSAR